MRDIKFRAWDKLFKEMKKVDRIDFDEKTINIVIEKNESIESFETLEFDQIELMQYTGLKDKYGTEIYEGDIANLKSTIYEDCSRTKVHDIEESTGEIKFFDNTWCIIRRSGERTEMTRLINFNLKDNPGDSDTDELEVIGNIYENPELLEGIEE